MPHQICKARGIFWRNGTSSRPAVWRLSRSLTATGVRPRGIAENPSREICHPSCATGGGARALVSKECDAREALSEIQTLHLSSYLPTSIHLPPPPLRVRGRVLSGCLHRYTVALVVLETVAIFARSWQEDNEARPDTRYTTVPCASLRRLSLRLARTFVLHHPPYIHRRPIIQPRRSRRIQPAKKRAGEGVRW